MLRAYVVGTGDTKGDELAYVRDRLAAAGVATLLVDLGTQGGDARADVTPREVAACHPDGPDAVFVDDRGRAVAAMGEAFRLWLRVRDDVGGIIGLGGSGGTTLVTPAMRDLPVGVPKVMVSTVASGDVAPYVGPSDIAMMPSVTDVAGLNRISHRVLGNAAHALAGMMAREVEEPADGRPAVGLTMFGVTTPCVARVVERLKGDHDCLVFHATGTGGRAMEKLVDSGLVAGVVDVTTTEVCDLLMGGVFRADEDRLGAVIRTRVPYVGSVGALDMVNFGAMATVPERYRGRNLYVHNPNVTLMRTTAEENARMGVWLAERLNRMEGPVRFLIPEGGVSAIDVPGQPFHDPEADRALFETLEGTFEPTPDRRLERLPHALNDPAFADALATAYRAIAA